MVEFARDTPFVLTSPTSLEACAQLDIEVKIDNPNFRLHKRIKVPKFYLSQFVVVK